MMYKIKTLEKKDWGCWPKIPNTSGLVKKTNWDRKITEIGNKIPSINGLVTTVIFNTKPQSLKTEYLISLNLATKAPLNKNVTEIEKTPDTSSFIVTHKFNKLTKISHDARITEAAENLASKSKMKNTLW